jgi:hypothetical protein
MIGSVYGGGSPIYETPVSDALFEYDQQNPEDTIQRIWHFGNRQKGFADIYIKNCLPSRVHRDKIG